MNNRIFLFFLRLSYIPTYFLFSVFPLYLFIGMNLMNVMLGFVFFLCLLACILTPNIKILSSVLLLLTLFLIFIGVSIYFGNNEFIAISQMLYYAKPIIFFVYGYYFLPRAIFDSLIKYVFIIALLGFVLFYSNIGFFMNQSLDFVGLKETGYYEGFGGLVYRNVSFFLSPLEFGGLLLFLFYYYQNNFLFMNKRIKNLVLFLIFVMMFLTFSRSIYISFLIYIFLGYVKINSRKKLIFTIVLIFIVSIFSLCVIFYNLERLEYFFLTEGSASVHHVNMLESLYFIFEYPLGAGIGSSGWPGYSENQPVYHYSEGSLLTTYIEFGLFTATLIYILKVKLAFLVSHSTGLLMLAIVIASLLIPLEYSTFVSFLLFGFIGSQFKLLNKF